MVCQAATFTGRHAHGVQFNNWDAGVRFAPADYWQPEHSDAAAVDGLSSLVDAVVEAGNAGQAIHAIGSGWAFEDLAASDGAMISLRLLDRRLDYVVGDGKGVAGVLTPDWRAQQDDPNSATVLVHVEAGIRIATLSEMLQKDGLAMPTLGGSNGQSLAGALSTSTHGGDWDQPPFPEFVRAIHLVGDDGQEKWIEPSTDTRRITAGDAELLNVLPCPDTEIVRDDRMFDAARVACGRFGVFYSLVLEVRRAFRVVEVIHKPTRDDVMMALRKGVGDGTLFTPLFDLLAPLPVPVADATGTPYFLQVLFSSQNQEDLWVHRRFVTTEPDNIPDDKNLVQGVADIDGLIALAVGPLVNVALVTAATTAAAVPIIGPGLAAWITLVVTPEYNLRVTGDTTLSDIMAASLNALWRIPYAGNAVPELNKFVFDQRNKDTVANGKRGPHHLMTSGTREDSDSNSFKSASIELVFDATRGGYLDFLEEILPVAPTFQQAGYISLRPSRTSTAYLSMHGFTGTHAMSIEIASLRGLPGNEAWMHYVERRAIEHGGRPHWGQRNRLDSLDVARLYSTRLEEWREGLLSHSGTSTRFSNAFTQQRGLEPTSVAREVTATRKEKGTITHLCNRSASWSPVSVGQAIDEIESGTVRYFVRNGDQITGVRVVGGNYLRTLPDDTSDDNLDELPGC